MNIHEYDLRLDLLNQIVRHSERIVVRCHEDAALKVDHGVSNSILSALIHPVAGQTGWIVGGTQHSAGRTVLVAIGRLKIVEDFTLIPHMVSSRDDVDSDIEEI